MAKVKRMQPPRILGVVSDLDGTLLRSDGSISSSTMDLLLSIRSIGTPLVVATARTPRAVRKVRGYQALGRVVCANGAVVWDAARDEVVREVSFDSAALTAAVAELRAVLPEAALALLSAQKMFVDERYVALRRNGAAGAELFTDVTEVLSQHHIVMVAVRHPSFTADQLIGAASTAFGSLGSASFAGAPTIDIAPRATTKAAAVADEMTAAGCPAGATVAFGDMPNDLPLFAWAGWACAVANSHPSVLEAADEVVPSNDDDGVAHSVQRLLGL